MLLLEVPTTDNDFNFCSPWKDKASCKGLGEGFGEEHVVSAPFMIQQFGVKDCPFTRLFHAGLEDMFSNSSLA